METAIIITIALAIGAICFYRHQARLRESARVMREAIRNKDFTFKVLPKGLFFGERAIQETLNDLSQHIAGLVAQNEVESWRRLTRVLTHEIMNATTPIQSISQAYLASPKIKGSIYEEGIQSIHDTSKSLASFVDSYRKLTQLQEPSIADINLREFVNTITSLYPSVNWTIDIPENSVFRADENLLRQVFINIIKNAIEANANKIQISNNSNALTISNDGDPIPPDVRRDIFIPFFTTKTTGNGIGLSISRQMLMSQGYNLCLSDKPMNGWHVTLKIERI